MLSHDVRAAAAAATAHRRRLSDADATDGDGRRAHRYAHSMEEIVVVATGAAALHRHGTRSTPAAPQLIPVAGRRHGV